MGSSPTHSWWCNGGGEREEEVLLQDRGQQEGDRGRETGSDPKGLLLPHPERTPSLGTAARLPVRS